MDRLDVGIFAVSVNYFEGFLLDTCKTGSFTMIDFGDFISDLILAQCVAE